MNDIQSYEELFGGTGRNIFFRPERYRVRSLPGTEATRLLIDGAENELFDISMNGLSFIMEHAGDMWPMGSECSVVLMVRDEQFFAGW